MKLALSGALLLALLLAGPAFAQAAAPVPHTFDLGAMLQALLPAVTDTIVSVLCLAGLWLAALLKDKLHVDIEAQVGTIEANNRGALHSAVQTALGKALSQYGPNLVITPNSPAATLILDLVKASVPEAVKLLGATDKWILDAAESKFALQVPPALTLSAPIVGTVEATAAAR